MFFWSARQAIFVLVMLVACVMALTHPVWQYWYEKIVPPLLIIMMILALDYANESRPRLQPNLLRDHDEIMMNYKKILDSSRLLKNYSSSASHSCYE
jgi:hypothetical protein